MAPASRERRAGTPAPDAGGDDLYARLFGMEVNGDVNIGLDSGALSGQVRAHLEEDYLSGCLSG